MTTEALLKREQLLKSVFAELNKFVDLKNTLNTVIRLIKESTGIEAVSIRLNEENDYPYFVHTGFPESFIRSENHIHHQSAGKKQEPINSKPKLDCLCGNVIRGTYNAAFDYYTEKGSYWTNSSTDNTPALLKNETNTHIRNHCNACGYESVGLFPIKTREENIGLIQLNDKRKNFFNNNVIEFMEIIGEQVGTSIENALLYEKLKNNNIELQSKLDELNHMQQHMLESKKMIALADMVTGIAHEINNPVNEAIYRLRNLQTETRKLKENASAYSEEIEEIINREIEIYNQINGVKELVNSFRSIAFDQFQENRHLINIKTFLEDVTKIIKATFKEKSIDYFIECNANAEIMSFGGVLSQVITHLIRNSYLHGFRHKNFGKVFIKCSFTDDDFFEIRIADNGSGIPENIKDKIFEPFFTTDKKNHLGLGLYTARNLMKNKLKGEIMFDDSQSETTDFVIRIPF